MTARRLGGIPPIVTVLITISAVVAAGLVAWFLFTTTSSATKQPMLEVTSAYALCPSASSCAVYVTLRNVGAGNVTIITSTSPPSPQIEVVTGTSITPITCGLSPAPPSNQVPAGGSVNLRCPSSSTQSVNIPDGASATLLLTVQPAGGSQVSLSLGFKIARP
jgi:copper(I)-binding protein